MQITIKAARINKGLKQSEAAKLLGIGRKTLSLYENGKTFPKVTMVEEMSRIYGVDKEAFIFLHKKNA